MNTWQLCTSSIYKISTGSHDVLVVSVVKWHYTFYNYQVASKHSVFVCGH